MNTTQHIGLLYSYLAGNNMSTTSTHMRLEAIGPDNMIPSTISGLPEIYSSGDVQITDITDGIEPTQAHEYLIQVTSPDKEVSKVVLSIRSLEDRPTIHHGEVVYPSNVSQTEILAAELNDEMDYLKQFR